LVGILIAIKAFDNQKGVTMKLFFTFLFLLTSVNAFADSFEQEKDGKVYLCEEKNSSNPAQSLSALCQMAKNGNGQTLYHANGKVFTYSAGSSGATWYYDNGKVITYSAGTSGSTFYYSNGKVLTYSAGTAGATWYYDNGKVITYSAGTEGATWYYPNGSVMTYSGSAMSEQALLYPCDYIQ
jgi:hypothetical protein